MDYDSLTLSASKKGLMMANRHFSNVLEIRLPGLMESLLKSSLEEGSFETVKVKPFLTKFSRTLYKNFEILEDAKLKFEFFKSEESKFLSVVNLSSSLHKKDSKKSRPSDKMYKKRKARFNRFDKSHKTYLKKFGLSEKSFANLVNNSPIFIIQEVPDFFRHFLWQQSFLDAAQKQIIIVFEKAFDQLLGDYGEKISELSIVLKRDRDFLEREIKNKIIVMVLKQENKLYLYDLRQVGSKIIKITKALKKLHLKGRLYTELFSRSAAFFKKEENRDITIKIDDFNSF